MREFFRGWSRKVGVVTLLMACVCLMGWIRSLTICDGITIPVTKHSMVTICSPNHALGIVHETVEDPSEIAFDFWSDSEGRQIDDILSEGTDLQWEIRIAGFVFSRSEYLPDFDNQFRIAVVPYWSIVLFLTVLSSSLLLSKPLSLTTEKADKATCSVTAALISHCFVQDWRRRIGLVSLVMACLCLGGWVRSLWYENSVAGISRRYNNLDHLDRLVSFHGEILWVTARNLNALHSYVNDYGGSMSSGETQPPYSHMVFEIPFNWRWRCGGFGYAHGQDSDQCNDCSIVVVPYWSIVIPLTALSAYLLLTKPRQSNQKKITEPTANEGGAAS